MLTDGCLDGINMLMLKHLGSTGVNYLTKALNLSLNTLYIRDVRKIGRVVTLLKPRNSAKLGGSNRTITTLSPVVTFYCEMNKLN